MCMHGAQFSFQHYQAMCVYMCVLFGVPMLRRFFVKYRIASYWYSHVTFLYLCQNRKNLILSNVTEERTVDAALYTGSTGGKTITTKRVLAQAMIPGTHLVKVQLAQSIYQQLVEPVLS